MADPALHVLTEGDGPCVVLGHGFAGSARNFRPQLRALRDRYRAVSFDARGHARSEAPRAPGDYGIERFVSDLGRVLERAECTRAVVGGLSMGALVGLRFALAHPERVRGLVLASFPAPPSHALAFAESIEREGLEAAGARFVWGPDSGLDAAGATLVRQGFLEHPPHALAAVLRELIAVQPPLETWGPRLGALTVPALVLAGERDAGSLAASRWLAAALPDARLVVIKGAGHVVNLARPDAFNEALLDFLDHRLAGAGREPAGGG